MDNRTEQLADGVWRIEVAAYVNAYVLANDGRGDADGLTVVDTGWRSCAPRLVRSIRLAGLDPRAVGDVLLTHCHPDHAGGAAAFAASSAASHVRVGAADLPTVQGTAPQPHAVARPPQGTRSGRLLGRFQHVRPVPGAGALVDGERLEVAGGLEVVAAPGHTPGHCALWLPSRGVLLAGDALFNVWRLSRGPRMLCSARPAIPSTLARLAALEPGTLAVAHGPPVEGRVAERLSTLAGSRP